MATLAFSRLFRTYSLRILTESLFILLCGLTLFALNRYRDENRVICRQGVWAGILLVLLFLTRYIGATMFFAAIMGFLSLSMVPREPVFRQTVRQKLPKEDTLYYLPFYDPGLWVAETLFQRR